MIDAAFCSKAGHAVEPVNIVFHPHQELTDSMRQSGRCGDGWAVRSRSPSPASRGDDFFDKCHTVVGHHQPSPIPRQYSFEFTSRRIGIGNRNRQPPKFRLASLTQVTPITVLSHVPRPSPKLGHMEIKSTATIHEQHQVPANVRTISRNSHHGRLGEIEIQPTALIQCLAMVTHD